MINYDRTIKTNMSETPSSPEARIHDRELAHLGALIVAASMREDLPSVQQEHVAATGVDNPNTVGKEGFFVAGEVGMSDENVYRQVGSEAVEDLAASGVVRNGATAKGIQHPRWGDSVFWHPGDSSKKMTTGGRMIVEADKSAAGNGWVPADKVRGIHARDSDGIVKNIIPPK
jgi:hypothetical protein